MTVGEIDCGKRGDSPENRGGLSPRNAKLVLAILHDATLDTELDQEGLNGVVAFTVTDRLKFWLFYDRLSVNFFQLRLTKKLD